jgi:transcriptional regulator with XRE-family HTH domain
MPRSLTTHIDSPARLGPRLREARDRAGLSQRQLAFDGCTAAYISRLEAGARVPSLQMVNELAARLGVSPQWLSTGVEVPYTEPTDLLEAEVALRLGDVDEAEKLFRARLQPGDPSRAGALAGLGQIAFRADRLPEAIDLLEQSLALNAGRALIDPSAVESLGRGYARTGAREAAVALFERALAEAREAQAAVEELRFAILLANALIDHGTFADAERSLADLIHLAEELHDPLASARVYWSQSRLHSVRGEAQLAARYARRALDILERTENTAYVGMAYHLLAFAEIEAGHGEAALQLLGRGRRLIGHELSELDDARFSIEEARAHVLVGSIPEAARAGARAVGLVRSITPADRGRAYGTLADVFIATGADDRALELYEKSLELLVEHGKPYAVELGRRYADLLEARGDTAGALRVLRRATDATASAVTARR